MSKLNSYAEFLILMLIIGIFAACSTYVPPPRASESWKANLSEWSDKPNTNINSKQPSNNATTLGDGWGSRYSKTPNTQTKNSASEIRLVNDQAQPITIENQLESLSRLLQKGLITKEEYEVKKKELLDKY